MQEEVKNYLDKIKPAVEGATARQLFENCNELASNPELREKCEKEMNQSLPDGYCFEITSAGFGKLHCPLAVTSNYPDAYRNRLWHASSLNGCVGYVEGKAEWAVVDADGGICVATCSNKKDADEVAKRLNGKKEPFINWVDEK